MEAEDWPVLPEILRCNKGYDTICGMKCDKLCPHEPGSCMIKLIQSFS